MSPKERRKKISHYRPIKCVGAAYTIGLLSLMAYLLFHPTLTNGKGGVYEYTKHGNPTAGVERIFGEPRGDCVHCHDEHASRDGAPTPGGPYDYLLFKANDNNLCYTSDGASACHATTGTSGVYQGLSVYEDSSHATSMEMYWPGPTPLSRPSSDYGKCLNCHTPHGYKDALGLIPSQTFSREENLCQTCHDGFPAIDVQSEITKPYRHPAGDYSGRHSSSEYSPGDFDSLNRHAECEDCHNPHYAKLDVITLSPPDASNRVKGVSGVDVINGAAGSQPSYTYIPPNLGVSYEYQLCFKCHSSWTIQPGGQPDMAALFNPNNPSYHPVEAQGQNTNIDSRAFVNGWAPTDTVYCNDCHTSDNSSVRGPHGSLYNYILRKNYVKSSDTRTMSPDEICFNCHRYDTYANNNASDAVKRYSRFSKHAKHTDKKQFPCYTCHNSHGSTEYPHLIVTGRQPGVVSYRKSGGMGYCAGTMGMPKCHMNEKSYEPSYPW
ncbi:MAG: cytochrome c3 family protein [Candidatus Poribacteria bacterium]